MSEAAVNGATVEFLPDSTWSWSGPSPSSLALKLTVLDPSIAPLTVNGQAVAQSMDVAALSSSLSGQLYVAKTFTVPGTLATATITIDEPTLSMTLKRGGAPAVLLSTTGKFTATVTSVTAAKSTSTPPTTDTALTKTGTWRISQSGENAPPKLTAS